MKRYTIYVDCFYYMKEINKIKKILEFDPVALLKHNFEVLGVYIDGTFVKIEINAENSSMKNIPNYCNRLIEAIVYPTYGLIANTILTK